MKKVGFLYTRLRVEEKLLLDELKGCGDVEIVQISDENQFFAIDRAAADVDVLFERSISYSRG